MRIKINFKKSQERFETTLNKEIQGFVHKKLLGEENAYHGKFSRYSISPMLGYEFKDGMFSYPNGGHIFISSDDDAFMDRIVSGLCHIKKDSSVASLGLSETNVFEICDFNPNEKFDMVRTLSPVIVKKDKRVLTYRDDGFIDVLREKSVKKLIHNGVSEKSANSIKMELFHPEKAAVAIIKLGRQTNITSRCMFIIRGSKKARKKLYELGLGVSTGFGFGAVSINKRLC